MADLHLPRTLEIAIFPLRTVLFPGTSLPLKIFEQRYLDMTKECIRDDAPFGVCLLRDGTEVGPPALPHPVGCTARILEWDMPHLGLFHLACRGERVFRIVEHWTLKNGLLRAQVELREPLAQMVLPSDYQPLAELMGRIINKFGEKHFPGTVRLDDADWVACRLAEALPLEAEFKQLLLEADDPIKRLDLLNEFLQTRSVTL
jgi:Lon protease-like protein